MKRLLIVLLAFALVAGLFTVAAAEDKLSLSGTMRVRAWDVENYYDFDDNSSDDEASYWDQRYRLAATIKANDAVSAHLRLDFAENAWGNNDWSGSRYVGNNELQVDRAYLQVHAADWATVKAGQLYFSTGDRYIVYDNNCTGIVWQLKFNPITVDLHYSKQSENGSLNDDNFDDAGVSVQQDDEDAYVAQVKYKAEKFSAGAFYAAVEDSTDADNSPSAIGLFGKFALGPVNFLAELDIFDGDESNTVEYTGTQLFVNAEWKMDALLLGGEIYYAEAADNDGTENQITWLGGNFGDFQPHTYGAFMEDYVPTPGGGNSVFDPTGDDAGSFGGSIYAKYIWDKLTLWGQVAYLEPDDDKMTRFDDFTVVNLSASYELVQNFTIAGMYSTTMVSVDDNGPDDDGQTLAARLQIKF